LNFDSRYFFVVAKTVKPSKSKISLRKSPKQERSKDLVSAVMAAAARILESAGTEALTTNKVAQMAGVSIGSLYQYFPGKDAIFSTLIEQQLDVNAAHYRLFIEAHKDDEAPLLLKALVDDVVDLFVERKIFIATLISEVPKLKKTRDVLYRRNKIVSLFNDLLKARSSELRDPSNVDQQVYVISHAILGILQTAVLENFESQTPEILKIELFKLITSYLLK
jgi:AcrR family transcriptional regulator